jgi:hypothetical protein
MSLIRQRRLRKKNWIDVKKGMSSWRLITLLGFTLLLIWYLDWRF